MKKNLKSIFNIILLIAITVFVLYWSLKDDFQNVVDQILHLNIFWLLVSIFLVFASWIFRSLSIYDVILKFDQNYTIKKAFHLTIVTQFFNAITPFATGGQPFQIYALKKEGISYTKGTNIIMQNFIVYQIALVLLGMLSVLLNVFFHIFKTNSLLKQLVTIGFVVNTFVVVFLFLIAFEKKFSRWILGIFISLLEKCHLIRDKNKKIKEWDEYVYSFHQGASLLFHDKKMFLKTIFSNFISLICLYLVPLSVLYGMGNFDMNVVNVLVSSSYTMLMGAFVPIPGGTGGLEYGYTCFFGNFIKGPVLHASMLIWRSITYYLGLIIGAIFLNIRRKRV